MEKHKVRLIPLIIVLLFTKCTPDEALLEELPQNGEEGVLATRTMITINKCVDSYVTVGDYTEYKGTHCWTEYYSTGGGSGGDSYYQGNEYDPGGSNPGGGGGGYGSSSNPSNFKFSHLEPLYAQGGSLNLMEKIQVDNVLMSFQDYSNIYSQLYNLLVQNKVKLKFGIDKEACEKKKANAFYSLEERGIYFHSQNEISIYTIIEEMIHAVQHNCFYGKDMTIFHKDCEFEAKVFQDMVNRLFLNESGGYVEYLPTFTDSSPTFASQYISWAENLYELKSFPYGQRMEFHRLCDLWNGYTGNSSPNFIPELLDHFFRKPIPDHQ